MRRGLHLPHHDGGPLHVATQHPDLGHRVEVRVRAPADAAPDQVHLRTTPDEEPTFATLTRDGTDEHGQAVWVGEVEVHDPCSGYRFLLEGGPWGYAWLTQAGLVGHDVTDEADFRLLAHPGPPGWVDDAWLYQVFPDRFARSGRVPTSTYPAWAEPAAWADEPVTQWPASMRQLYGGDLWGVAERLDHLERLGVTGAYLNPIFPAQENHRYCATAFDRVDPALGGDEALAALSGAMHQRGMRLVGDLTANHSGSAHPWFIAAQAGEEPERGFYHFTDWPHEYEAWAGVPTLPKFDHRADELRARLYEGDGSVVARWLRDPIALDGWRIDAANMTGRSHDVDVNAEVAAAILATMRAERGDEVYLLAEHCHDATRDLERRGWHGTMNYTGFTRPLWTWLRRPDTDVELPFLGQPLPVPRLAARAVVDAIVHANARMPWRAQQASLTLLGSHDTARWATVAGDRDRALVGVGLLATLPGVPSLLYGDEWGLPGATDDAGRRPMPWHDASMQDQVMFEGVRRLIALRRDSVALRRGGLRWADSVRQVRGEADADEAIVFLREHGDERVLVAASRVAHGELDVLTGPLVTGPGEALLDHPDIPARTGDRDRSPSLRLPASDAPAVRAWRV